MDLDGAQQLIGLAVPVTAPECVEQIVPSGVGRLLDVTSRSGANFRYRFGAKLDPRWVDPGVRGDLTAFAHRWFRMRGERNC